METYEMHSMPPLGAERAQAALPYDTPVFGLTVPAHKEQKAAGRPLAVPKSDSRRSLSADAS